MKLKEHIEKHIKKILVPFSIFCAAVGLTTLYLVSDVMTTSNDECLWNSNFVNEDSVEILFDFVKFEGVTWNAGIRDGDQLLRINGVEITNLIVATVVLNQVVSGDSALYQIKRKDFTFETKVEIKKLVNIRFFTISVFSLIWMIVGILVIMAKPLGYLQRIFYLIGVLLIFGSTLILNDLSFFADTFINNIYIKFFADILALIGCSYFSFVFIHFFWMFPRKFKILNYKFTLKIMYVIPTILFLVLITIRIFSFRQVEAGSYFSILLALGVFGLVSITVGLVSLFISYIKLETKLERNSIFVILISYIIGVVSIIYFVVVINTLPPASIYNSPEYFVPLIFVILIPISFGYSIFKYSLMDVSDVFKNAIIYGSATISIAGTYFLIIYLIGQYVSQAITDEYQGVIAGFIFIGFALLFQSTKDKFQDLLTAKFYPEQFAFQKMLIKFSKDVSTIVGLDNILESIKQTFIDTLKLQKVGIVLKSKDENVCTPRFAVGFNEKACFFEEKGDKIQELISEKEKLNRMPVIEQNEFEQLFPENYFALKKEGIYTIIPLTIKSKVIGLALFGLKYSGSQFAGKDLELLVAVCNQIAVSIENARLYESESEKLKIERDLENAEKIQKSLLPKIIPQIQGLEIAGSMIPAMQVGGDYYDLIKVDDKKLFVIVGDVSGKGLSASFYMSKLHTMMRLFCSNNTEPKDILIEINKRIYESIEKNWFITISIGLFDLEKNTLSFCRAGHTPLIIGGPDKTETYTPKGIGVGLEPGSIFDSSIEQIELDLKDGQLFSFFSDGISEEMNGGSEFFGIDRIKKLLIDNYLENAQTIKNKILHSVKLFKGSRQQSDDITLVLVKYTS